jgi:hypothetical protein
MQTDFAIRAGLHGHSGHLWPSPQDFCGGTKVNHMNIWKILSSSSPTNDLAKTLRTLPQYDWSKVDMHDKKVWETTSEMGSIVDKQLLAKGVSAKEAASIMLAKTNNGKAELMKLDDKLMAVQPYYAGRSVLLISLPDGSKGDPSATGSHTTSERYVIALRHSAKVYSILQYRYEHYQCID